MLMQSKKVSSAQSNTQDTVFQNPVLSVQNALKLTNMVLPQFIKIFQGLFHSTVIMYTPEIGKEKNGRKGLNWAFGPHLLVSKYRPIYDRTMPYIIFPFLIIHFAL